MLEAYRAHAAERAALGIPPLPLTAKQTGELVDLLLNPPKGEEAFLVDLLTQRVPAGVDDAAKVKAAFLAKSVPARRRAHCFPARRPRNSSAPCLAATTSSR